MADLADVSATLVGVIGGILYPNGTSNPPLTGFATRVFPGWPQPAQLDADLRAQRTQISVYPRAEERNTTRYVLKWQPLTLNMPTLTLTIVEQTVVVAGAIPTLTNPHNAMVMVNGFPYVYAVQPTDTLYTIAAALATLIAQKVPGTVSIRSVIHFPGSANIMAARIGVTGAAAKEVRRQDKLWQITIWAPTPQQRTALAKVIDPVLAQTFFLNLPDLSMGRLIYKSTVETDSNEKQLLYRRDLFYLVEYPTIIVETETQITEGVIQVGAEIAGLPPAQPITTVYY